MSAHFHRRQFLQIGALGLGGLTLEGLLRGEARGAKGRAKAKSVIMVCLPGGPSHIVEEKSPV